MAMLKYWRSLVVRPTYNWRTALVEAVYPVLGKEKAFSILSGDTRHSGKHAGNVIKYLEDTIMFRQALNIANILEVGNINSDDKLTSVHVLNVIIESVKRQIQNKEQRQHLCKRLHDKGFRTFSAKLAQVDCPFDSENKSIPEEIDKAIKEDVAIELSRILEVRVELSKEGTSFLKQVLDEWIDTLRSRPLNLEKRICLSDRLLRELYVDFSLEVMIGFESIKTLDATKINTKPTQSSTSVSSPDSSVIPDVMHSFSV
nr:uncharacterized protein LOC129266872 [Lytechinus pictus]